MVISIRVGILANAAKIFSLDEPRALAASLALFVCMPIGVLRDCPLRLGIVR
jgi:hypothetical protein